MKVANAIYGLLILFVTMPIWYYLLYKVLESVHASDVMWLLYWIYVPVGILAGILKAIADAAFK